MSTTAATAVPTGTWNVDPAHSSVEFRVKHLGSPRVTARFREFEGTMEMRGNLASSGARRVVKAASIDTNEPQRDEHLRSPDFFDVEDYPDITFESTRSCAATST